MPYFDWVGVRGGRVPVAIPRFSPILVLSFCLAMVVGCWFSNSPEVIVYSAQDQEFAAPVLERFATVSAIQVVPKFDVESSKSVGLAQALVAERRRPRCDVFWNNEILHTIRLARIGMFETLPRDTLAAYPKEYQDPHGTWCGFAARARVLLVNSAIVTPDQYPRSIHELAESRWKGQIGIAKPLFGTTATHAAVVFASWGQKRGKAFFREVKQNAVVLAGNRPVAEAVAHGRLAWGLTDSDDAILIQQQGFNVEIVYPDQVAFDGEPAAGTLFIPNTIGVIRGSPHPDHAKRLADWLLSDEVESLLAASDSAQIPLREDSSAAPRIETPWTIKAWPADFNRAADAWQESARFLGELFR